MINDSSHGTSSKNALSNSFKNSITDETTEIVSNIGEIGLDAFLNDGLYSIQGCMIEYYMIAVIISKARL